MSNPPSPFFSRPPAGYQDARGGDGGDWYVSNVFEELDAPGEWFFDKAAKKLYVFWNATAGTPPPSDGSVVAIADGAWGIINVTATQAAPITGLSINGVGFRDTAHVFFAPHSIPSGGDWALARLAALQLEGTEGAAVDSCVFERLDGMAVLLSGYNRNARLTRNAFKWIGDSAMVAWGRTTGDPTGQDGWDGTDGNQPRYTVVEYNIASEVGIWEKQSSLYMQAKTSDSWLHGNVGFNGPRAGVNFVRVWGGGARATLRAPAKHFLVTALPTAHPPPQQNDGFGGNSSLWKNLIFNVCRESVRCRAAPCPFPPRYRLARFAHAHRTPFRASAPLSHLSAFPGGPRAVQRACKRRRPPPPPFALRPATPHFTPAPTHAHTIVMGPPTFRYVQGHRDHRLLHGLQPPDAEFPSLQLRVAGGH